MDTVRSSLVGEHISNILQRFALPRCPEVLRRCLEKQQEGLIGRILSDLAPHSEATVFFDNRGLIGTRYNGLYRLWVHADKVSPDPTGAPVGVFVSFRVEQIEEKALQVAINQALTKCSSSVKDTVG
jgi:hypothetical protein